MTAKNIPQFARWPTAGKRFARITHFTSTDESIPSVITYDQHIAYSYDRRGKQERRVYELKLPVFPIFSAVGVHTLPEPARKNHAIRTA
jgi:hypothetical protein